MAQGSGGYNPGVNFGQIESSLRNIALSYGAIMSAQTQIFASINAWRMLERELTLANAAAGGTRAEFQAMEQSARRFALATTFSAAQVGQAFYSLASAGFSVRESLQAATGVVLLAQATLTDLGEASDVTASTLQQFNLAAYESYRVSNLFVAATNSSLATMPKLMFALRQVGPIAHQANLSLEETVGLLDALFDVGLRGEQAGTALRNSLTKLMSPVGEGQTIMKALGIELIDEATGKMRDYIEILEDLSTKNLSNNAIIQIVGVEAAAGFAAQLQAVRKSADGANSSLRQHIQDISNTNAAYTMAMQQMATLDGQLAITANAFNDLRIELGQGLAPMIVSLATMFRELVDDIKAMNGEQILGYANLLIMIGGFYAAGKAVSVLIGGLAKATIQMNTFRRNTLGATVGLSRFMAVGGTLLGMTMGIAGLALAAWGLYEAFKATGNAADDLRTKNVTGNLLGIEAKKQGMDPGQAEAFSNLDNYLPQVRQEAGNLETAYGFDKETGSGAFQTMKMRQDAISRWSALARVEDAKIKELIDNVNKNRANWAELGNSMAQYYQQSNLSMLKNTQGGTSVEGQIMFLTEMQGDAKRTADTANRVINDMAALANTTSADAHRKVDWYFSRRIEDINNMAGISEQRKQMLRQIATQQAQKLKKGEANGLAIFLQELGKGAEEELKDIETRGGFDQAFMGVGETTALNSLENILEQGYDTAVTELVLTEEQFRQKVGEVRARREALNNIIRQEQAKLGSTKGAVGKELVGVLRGAATFTPEELKQFDAFFNSKEGQQAIQFVSDRLADGTMQMNDAIDSLIKWTVRSRQEWAKKIDRGAALAGAVPLFDLAKLRDLNAKNKRGLDDVAIAWAELAGDPDEIEALFRAAQGRRKESGRDTVVTDFLQDIAGTDEEMLKAVQDLMQGPKRAQLTAALARYGESRQTDRAALNQVLKLLGDDVLQNAVNLKPGIDAFAEAMFLGDEQIRLAIGQKNDELDRKREQEAKKRQREAKDKTDELERLLKELMGLPSQEELMLATARIRLNTRNAVSEFYDMPLQGIVKEMDALEIDFRERMLAMQEKFRGFYTNTLTQGIDAMMNDPVMADAFSGRLLQRIKADGKADVFGKVFTAQMVSTTEGMNAFIKRIQDQFAQGAQGSIAGRQRIEQAGRMLRAMTEQVGSEFDLFSEQFQVLRIKHAALENEMREFSEDFNREQLIRNFENLLLGEATGATGRNSLDLIVEVGIQAKTSRIILDTEDAIRQLREKYQEAFANIGVETTVNAKTGRLELLQRVGTAPGAVGGGYAPGAVTTGNIPQASVNAAAVAAYESIQRAKAPLRGNVVVTGQYGERRGSGRHGGVDLRAAVGTEVLAPLDGVIKHIGDSLRGGLQMAIDHGNGLITTYAHLSRKLLAAGTQVKQGDVFALSGNTGINPRTGRRVDPHVHMGAYQGGQRIDPASLGGRNINVAVGSGAGRTAEQVAYDELRAQLPLEQQIVEARRHGNTVLAEQLETRVKIRDALIVEYNREVDNLIKIQEARIDWWKKGNNAQIMLEEERAATTIQIWEETEGKILEIRLNAMRRVADAARRTQETGQAAFGAGMYGDVVGGLGIQNDLRIGAERRELELRRQEEINAIKADARLTTAEQAEAEEQINFIYAERIALLTEGVQAQRDAYDAAAANLEALAHRNGNTEDDPLLGLRAAVLDFAATVPTVFETVREGALMAMQGIAEVGAGLLTGTEQNARQAVANILRSISMLLAKMLIMYGVMQMIRAIPGGTALLSAMDLGASAAGAVGKNAKGGTSLVPGATEQLPEVWTGPRYARGGVARGPQLAMFGEGRTPEAYVPMEDHRSVQVRIDDKGNAYIPLPSGQTIPVRLDVGNPVRRFALGGVGGYDRKRAFFADSAVSSSPEAVAPWRRAGGGNVTNHTQISVPITINGNASEDDADRIGREVAKRIDAVLREREAESARQYSRRGGSIAADYGVQ